MAINWARGLDELGTGLLRQADIGNKAYEGAMAKEAETRSANRAFAAEERAAKRDYDKEIRQSEARESQFARGLEHDLDIQRLGHEYSIDELIKRAELQEESDLKKFGRESAFTLKTWRMERYAAIRDAETKATNARELLDIKNNVSRAESSDKKVTSLLTALAKAIKDGETAESDRLSRELEKAELQSTEAWARIPGVDPLTTRQLTEFKRFSIVGDEIVNAVSLRTTDTIFREAITAIKQGEGSSGYDAAIETVSRTIDDIIENDPTFKNYRGTKKRDLKKHIIKNLLPNVQLGEETATDGGNGEVDVGGTIGFRQEASVAIERLSEMSEEDLINSLETGALAAAEELPSPDRPGRTGNPKLQAVESAKKRDPAHLLDILKEARNKPAYGSRIDKIDKLIGILERFLANPQASALPDPVRGYPDLAMAQPAGMLGQEPGMIFEADQMPMDARSVNARYTA